MREYIGNSLLHIGWAIFGQPCDCGYGIRLNALARKIGSWEYDEESWRDRALFNVGCFILFLAARPYFEDVL